MSCPTVVTVNANFPFGRACCILPLLNTINAKFLISTHTLAVCMMWSVFREPPTCAYRLCRLGHDHLNRSLSTGVDSFGAPPAPPTRRVVVTGIGLVTPLGVGAGLVWDRLLAGETAVRALTEDDLPPAHRAAYSSLPSKVVACVPRQQLTSAPWAPTNIDARRDAPFILYALTAAAEALQDAQWSPTTVFDRQMTGVAIGAGMSSTMDIAEAGMLLASGSLRRLSPFFVPRALVNMASGAVSIAHGLQGPHHAASTACASGAHAIGDAFRLVQRGDAKVMVAGGTEACVDAVALAGFGRLRALSTQYNDRPTAASRPFDAGRDGFVLGEGAGVLVLEELRHAQDRGARIYAEIRGYGLSGDAHHITQPAPDGAGAQLAMTRAMASAGLSPEHVAYINAHATSTPIGDDIEQRAIASVFGSAVDKVFVSSSKGAVGHLLGAAGAVEAAFSVLSLHSGWAPPNCNLESPEHGSLPGLVAGGQAVRLRPGPWAVLKNSFGFGGVNASLVFGPSPA